MIRTFGRPSLRRCAALSWRGLAALALAFSLGCASAAPYNPDNPLDKWDPIEPFNRHVYKFNADFDRWVLLPVAHVYEYLPRFMRVGVRNFFDNFGQVSTTLNSALQGSPRKTGVSAARVVVNTTVGLLGFFDPATHFGLGEYDEDFGQTLGVWGVGAGPYLVLPVFGPSSFRDGTGLAADRLSVWGMQALLLGDLSTVLTVLTPIEVVSIRSWDDFRYGELGPFEYELIRYTHMEYRQALVDE